MELIGELLEPITTNLYAWRVPIAVASVVGSAAIAVLAWRLGWLAAARRHPVRAGALAAAAILVGVPITWYLASPIFLRTSLIEAAPTPVATSTPPTATPISASSPVSTGAPTAPPTAAPTPTPFVATTIASGAFAGTDDFHFGRGTASIIEIEPGRYHLRFEDFAVRNGPDLFVYLSPDAAGYDDDALELGRLKATDGSFGYDLPAAADPADYRSAIIWCKQFAHLFAVAPFAG